MEDKDNLISEIIRRVNNSRKFSFLSDDVSLAAASNIIIITEEEAKEIGKELGGKFNSKLVLRHVFQTTYSMIIAVIDRDYDMITFYHRNIEASSTVSVKDLRKGNKKNSSNEIMEALRAYNLGNAPTF